MSFQAPTTATQPLPSQVLNSLCDFLAVAFHSLLHDRGIYPPHLFTSAQMYLLAVKACRSQPVVSYIQSVVDTVKPSLGNRTVDALHFVVYQPKNPAVPLELFTFSVTNARIPADAKRGSNSSGISDDSTTAIEAHFRGVLTKLSACKAPSFKLSPGEYPTFRIIAHAVNRQPVNAGQASIAPLGNDWLPATNVPDIPDLGDMEIAQYGLRKVVDPVYTFKSRGLIIVRKQF
ncbi:DNA-binding protein, partial [Catenaria anguillulae PL171]